MKDLMIFFSNIKTAFYAYYSDENLRSWLKQDEFTLLYIHTLSYCVWKFTTVLGYFFMLITCLLIKLMNLRKQSIPVVYQLERFFF